MAQVTGTGVRGLQIAERSVRATNRTGADTVVGDLYKLDPVATDGLITDNNTPGSAAGDGLANIVVLADDDTQLVVVATEVIADDVEGTFVMSGRVNARVDGGVTIGQKLECDGSLQFQLLAAGGVCYGFCLTAPGTADAIVQVIFDGVNGFGGGAT